MIDQLKASEIKAYRELCLKKQRYTCPLCKTRIEPEEAALDHCHKTGNIRAALHFSCNAAEGKILHWAGQRSRGDDPIEFLKNLIKYWQRDYSETPLHPTHGKPRRRKRRKPRK